MPLTTERYASENAGGWFQPIAPAMSLLALEYSRRSLPRGPIGTNVPPNLCRFDARSANQDVFQRQRQAVHCRQQEPHAIESNPRAQTQQKAWTRMSLSWPVNDPPGRHANAIHALPAEFSHAIAASRRPRAPGPALPPQSDAPAQATDSTTHYYPETASRCREADALHRIRLTAPRAVNQ